MRNPIDAPPLPPEVRERVLRRVLDGMAEPEREAGPGPARRLPWTPLLAVAAVLLVAVAAVVALPATRPDPVSPAAPLVSGSRLQPLPPEQLPAPSGDVATDLALVRCATAAIGSGRGDKYPPTAEWRVTGSTGFAGVETELTIDDRFVCALTPDTVFLSGTSGRVVSGVGLVRMAPGRLLLLNPARSRVAVGYSDTLTIVTDAVIKVDLDPGAPLSALRLVIDGAVVPAGQPLQPDDTVDRELPLRPDFREPTDLAACLAATPGPGYTDPRLWFPVGLRPPAPGAPAALVARIGDAAAGFCRPDDPAAGFVSAALPPPGGRPRLVARSGGALLLTTPPGVTGVRVTAGDRAAADCPVFDGLAMCTVDDPAAGQPVVVTATTAADTQPVQIYWG